MRKIIMCSLLLLLSDILLAENNNTDYKKMISELSESYFQHLSLEKYDLAYDSIGTSFRVYNSEEVFLKHKRKFRSITGNIESINISKITVYENPADAPAPGVYAAADYYNSFAGVPIHCGYLVWFMGEGQDTFKIIREETGFITKDQLAEIPAEQLQLFKKELLCVEP